MTCEGCDHAAAYHGDRERTLTSAVGAVRYRRAYYYCRRCGRGIAPFDEQAGITARALTPAAERLAALAGGVCHGFEEAADLLKEVSGVRLSESTVERTTQDVGRRIEGCLSAGVLFGLAVVWRWYRDAKGRTVTVKGPQGNVETVKVRDPKNLAGVKVGDLVELTYTQALAIALEPAPASDLA